MRKNSRPCLSLFKAPHICKDGKVVVCCRDFELKMTVGDLNKQSLEEIWFSDEITEMRLAHIRGDFDSKTPLCHLCDKVPELSDEEVKEFLKYHKKEEFFEEYLERVNSD